MSEAGKLHNYFYQLYKTLLEAHVISASLKPTAEEEISVKAFCVLAHAAVEEFIEYLSKNILQKAYKKYKSKSILSIIPSNSSELTKVNLGIVQLIETLLLASNFSTFSRIPETLKNHKSKLDLVSTIYNSGSTADKNQLTELTKNTSSYTVDLLKDTRKFFDSHIESNNGASLKYLLRILIPVGIDIPNIIELNSLQKLAEYRGSFAHGIGVSNIISTPDLISYAKDVIKLCRLIENSVDDFYNI